MASRLELQRFHLERLARIVKLRAHAGASWTDAQRHLVDLALFSTYQDCERAGLMDVARAVVMELSNKVSRSQG